MEQVQDEHSAQPATSQPEDTRGKRSYQPWGGLGLLERGYLTGIVAFGRRTQLLNKHGLAVGNKSQTCLSSFKSFTCASHWPNPLHAKGMKGPG